VDDDATDWLDRTVFDPGGVLIGAVVGVYNDASRGQSTWLAVGMGPFSLRTAIVPMAGALLWGNDVVVAHDRTTVLEAPAVDVVVSLVADDEARLVEHYAHPTSRSKSPRPPTESST
jgi:hypothetical protein